MKVPLFTPGSQVTIYNILEHAKLEQSLNPQIKMVIRWDGKTLYYHKFRLPLIFKLMKSMHAERNCELSLKSFLRQTPKTLPVEESQ